MVRAALLFPSENSTEDEDTERTVRTTHARSGKLPRLPYLQLLSEPTSGRHRTEGHRAKGRRAEGGRGRARCRRRGLGRARYGGRGVQRRCVCSNRAERCRGGGRGDEEEEKEEDVAEMAGGRGVDEHGVAHPVCLGGSWTARRDCQGTL